ncbi:mitochondrial sodium/calcium exchanger protein [Orussus abietinus]|uniref:mitochondrial sodium/calcium exchanger protein n=1 Tax=Orussus abietinus TaxID=222816 RepID=UPI000625F034|nr:mitochondrial sodium/calcium exchanger protein [Orussus abietinus]
MLRSLKSIDLKHGGTTQKDDCTHVWDISTSERCDWVKRTHDCETDSVIQYAHILFCIFNSGNPALFALGLVLLSMWLMYLFFILGTTADNFFCPSLSAIATVLRLSANVAGVTILAFGNGAPDIFTSLVSDEDEAMIMFTELIGAGIFVTTLIAGTIAVVSPFQVSAQPFIRDACFYVVAVCWITYVIKDETVYVWEAASFVAYYIFFIIIVITMQVHDRREEKQKGRIPNARNATVFQIFLANRNTDILPQLSQRARAFSVRTKLDTAIAAEVANAELRGESVNTKQTLPEIPDIAFSRPTDCFEEFIYDINPINKYDWDNATRFMKIVLIIRAPFMFVLQLLIPVVDETVVKRGWSKLLNCLQICIAPAAALFALNVWRLSIGPVPVFPIIFLIGLAVGICVFTSTSLDHPPKFHNIFAFFGFFVAMTIVYLVAQEVMGVLKCVGFASGISDAMLGITLLAWGNSIGDLIANITIARQGFPRMGYSACIGGPMFNTLLGLGLTYGYRAVGEPDYKTKVRTSDMAPGCLAFLLCSLVSSLTYLHLTGFSARRSYGYLLYTVYATFLLISILSEIHVIHPLGTDHREDSHEHNRTETVNN